MRRVLQQGHPVRQGRPRRRGEHVQGHPFDEEAAGACGDKEGVGIDRGCRPPLRRDGLRAPSQRPRGDPEGRDGPDRRLSRQDRGVRLQDRRDRPLRAGVHDPAVSLCPRRVGILRRKACQMPYRLRVDGEDGRLRPPSPGGDRGEDEGGPVLRPRGKPAWLCGRFISIPFNRHAWKASRGKRWSRGDGRDR